MSAPSVRGWGGIAGWVVLVVVLWFVPGNIGRGPQEIVLNLLIWVGLAQAWNVIGGIGGQMSLGHSVFVGAGGYTAAMLIINAGLPWVAGLLAGAVVAAAVAWVVSFPLLRLSGPYFTIGSAAVSLIAIAWMVAWEWTGASSGLNIPFDRLPDKTATFRLVAVLAVATCVVTTVVLRSSFGLRLMAVRDDEGAAAALGVAPRAVKRQAFVISAALTGLVGAAIAFNQVSINPTSMFSLDWVVTALVMAIVGGLGTTWGPVIGAFVVYYLVDRALQDQPILAALLGGALIIVVISIAPGGIVGELRRGWAAVRRTRGDDGRTGTPAGDVPQEVTTS